MIRKVCHGLKLVSSKSNLTFSELKCPRNWLLLWEVLTGYYCPRRFSFIVCVTQRAWADVGSIPLPAKTRGGNKWGSSASGKTVVSPKCCQFFMRQKINGIEKYLKSNNLICSVYFQIIRFWKMECLYGKVFHFQHVYKNVKLIQF